jgi:Cas10/Cmr2, second palm domain
LSGRAVGRYWTVIETGGNQSYIFGSSKQAANVGASELIARVGTRWLADAAEEVRAGGDDGTVVDPVVRASGKALVLVDSPRTGKEITRAVTRRALGEAPGLQVWGVTDDQAIGHDRDVGPALKRAHRLHAAWRSRLPSVHLRHPTLPFTRPCHYSGQPATTVGREGDELFPRGAGIDAAWRVRDAGRDRMAASLGSGAVVGGDQLNDGVRHAGWVAVVHADGNGIGEIFSRLGERCHGDEFLKRLARFSAALDRITIEAFAAAIRAQPDCEDWILPLVVGGDDVTTVMDARFAFDVTTTYLRTFARLSAETADINDVIKLVRQQPFGLTACAGIAYVKPRSSFSEAYQMADALCGSAKWIKTVDARCGALDFHVQHDSFGHDLDRVRDPLQVRDVSGAELRLWAGPVVVAEHEMDGAAGARHERELRRAMAELRDPRSRAAAGDDEPGPAISRAGLHRLRQALPRGEAAIDRTVEQVVSWAPDPEAARAFLEAHLRVPAGDGSVAFSRVLSAADLLDMAAGTAEWRTPWPAAVPQ